MYSTYKTLCYKYPPSLPILPPFQIQIFPFPKRTWDVTSALASYKPAHQSKSTLGLLALGLAHNSIFLAFKSPFPLSRFGICTLLLGLRFAGLGLHFAGLGPAYYPSGRPQEGWVGQGRGQASLGVGVQSRVGARLQYVVQLDFQLVFF